MTNITIAEGYCEILRELPPEYLRKDTRRGLSHPFLVNGPEEPGGDEAIAHGKRLQAMLDQGDLELAKARDRIGRIEQEKDAAALDSGARLEALSVELARTQHRAAGNERHLLEEADRARQELKSTQKRPNDATRRLNEARAENDSRQTALETQVRLLEAERARLQERLAASERRSSELGAQLAARLSARGKKLRGGSASSRRASRRRG